MKTLNCKVLAIIIVWILLLSCRRDPFKLLEEFDTALNDIRFSQYEFTTKKSPNATPLSNTIELIVKKPNVLFRKNLGEGKWEVFNGANYLKIFTDQKRVVYTENTEQVADFLTSEANLFYYQFLIEYIRDNKVPLSFNGIQVVNGRQCYVIEAIFKEGVLDGKTFIKEVVSKSKWIIYLDKEKYLPIRVIKEIVSDAKKRTVVQYGYKYKGTWNNLYQVKELPRLTDYSNQNYELLSQNDYFEEYYANYKMKIQGEIDTLGKKIKNFEFLTGNSEKRSLETITSDYVLIEYWFKNCGYCKALIPRMNDLRDKFPDKKLSILGLNPIDKNPSFIKSYVASNEVSFPLALVDRDITSLLKPSGYPSLYLLNREREIIFGFSGSFSGPYESMNKFVFDEITQLIK